MSRIVRELVLANHILAFENVLDAYGHVSVRSKRNPNHFFLARHFSRITFRGSHTCQRRLRRAFNCRLKYTASARRTTAS